MTKKMEDYIFLVAHKRDSNTMKYVIEKNISWRIYYDESDQCFMCFNVLMERYTKMKNVDDFLKIWINDIYAGSYNLAEAKIIFYIQGQIYSEHSCVDGKPRSEDNVLRYVSALKNII